MRVNDKKNHFSLTYFVFAHHMVSVEQPYTEKHFHMLLRDSQLHFKKHRDKKYENKKVFKKLFHFFSTF